MIRSGAAALLLFTLACGGANRVEPDRADTPASGENTSTLASSVEVEVRGDSVRLVLHVTNPANRPVVLEFTSGQRYDFAIRTAAGADVWRWSADKSFIQVLGSETIPPGGTVDYSEVWMPGDRTGSFVAVAELTATNYRVREQAPFEITARTPR